MIQYLIVILIFMFAISIFLFGLHFSKYKKRNAGCCGGGHCSTDEEGNDVHSCYSEKSEFVKKYKTVS